MKIIFFTGKGGVGKSTISAAAAWQLSQKFRVLIVSLDPAHNLGDIYGVQLNDKKKRFTEGLTLKEIDLKGLSREYLQKEISILSTSYKYLQTLNLDSYFSILQYSPGIEEYALLTSIEDTLRSEGEYDYVIFDTPPTGLTLRFLALPAITITWIERLMKLRRQILEKRYTIHRIRGACSTEETLLVYDESEDEVLNTLKSLDGNYRRLNEKLKGADCSVVLVFNPDTLSLRESERLIRGLDDLHLPLRLLVDNKITDETLHMADRVEKVMLSKTGPMPLKRVEFSRTLDGATRKLYDIEEDLTSSL